MVPLPAFDVPVVALLPESYIKDQAPATSGKWDVAAIPGGGVAYTASKAGVARLTDLMPVMREEEKKRRLSVF